MSENTIAGTMDSDEFLASLRALLGPSDLKVGREIPQAHLSDWSGEIGGAPMALCFPRSTESVSKILTLCHQHRVPVVPQGGLTGLAGGAVPSEQCLLLSLSRMCAIECIDSLSATATVLAGTPLQQIQEAAEAEGMMFALDLGTRGTCQIGGNIATNAGGNRVIRYGMTRELVLGLEVVLADGTVLSMMNQMPKNNAGMDLKPLFIGSEGTLGIITRAVLRLHPGVSGANTALLAVADFDTALKLLNFARRQLSDRVSAFELMWADYVEGVSALPSIKRPAMESAPMLVLLDMQGPDPEQDNAVFLAMLESAMERGWVVDAAVAQSQREAAEFWAMRDAVAELLAVHRPTVNFDVSVPIACIGECVERMRAALEAAYPEMKRFFFGHIGDSNIHLVTGPLPDDPAVEHHIEAIVYDLVREYAGSISAEHGIGLHKKPWLSHSRTEAEIAVLKQLKTTFDPFSLLNPGKVL